MWLWIGIEESCGRVIRGNNTMEKYISDKPLGAIYSKEGTLFRVFSPLRDDIRLRLYKDARTLKRREIPMTKEDDGTFYAYVEGDLDGYFYTYLVQNRYEVTDPYSYGSSINSVRSAILDLPKTNPDGWEDHTEPGIIRAVDSIIYEVHIKDFTYSKTSGVKNRGTYLGFVEEGTKYGELSTGIDHLKELGITHVHLMPIYDFLTVKEDREFFFDDDNYNWGYDPELYNVLEGSYSLNPHDPKERIREFKTLVMKLHQSGMKVVMDVVYNHTYRSIDSNFNILLPNYYYRINSDGSFSNGSGCGNEFESRNPMGRRFIIDSLKYWVNEFKIDGFRFDLMALIDIETMEEAVKELRKLKDDILIYGEPWTGGITTLPSNKTTSKGTQGRLGFGVFNDNFRNAVKGDNDGHGLGFAQGNLDERFATETGIAGSIYYDDGHIGFAASPKESINYVNSHDNLILQDKLLKILPNKEKSEYIRYNKFIHSILFLSQGVPFIHAGNEFMRTKDGHENTYNSPISINKIDWSLKEKNNELFQFMKELILFRKENHEFRMDNAKEIKNRLKFLRQEGSCFVLAYTIKSNGNYLLIIHNANPNPCLMPHSLIQRHIKTQDERTVEDVAIVPIFNENGRVKETTQYTHPHGIETPRHSTYVYRLEVK